MTEVTVYYTASSLSSETLLRRAAARFAEVGEDSVDVLREPGEKPVILSPKSVHASVSHSGGVWAAAFSRDCALGLDLQKIVDVRRREGILRRYFHPDEGDYVRLSDNPARAFCEVWSRKEAAVKQSGRGIDGEFASFSSVPDVAAVFGCRLRLLPVSIPERPDLVGALAVPAEAEEPVVITTEEMR